MAMRFDICAAAKAAGSLTLAKGIPPSAAAGQLSSLMLHDVPGGNGSGAGGEALRLPERVTAPAAGYPGEPLIAACAAASRAIGTR